MKILDKINIYLSEKKDDTVELECMECGKIFKKKSKSLSNAKCPKCKSQDLEVV